MLGIDFAVGNGRQVEARYLLGSAGFCAGPRAYLGTDGGSRGSGERQFARKRSVSRFGASTEVA